MNHLTHSTQNLVCSNEISFQLNNTNGQNNSCTEIRSISTSEESLSTNTNEVDTVSTVGPLELSENGTIINRLVVESSPNLQICPNIFNGPVTYNIVNESRNEIQAAQPTSNDTQQTNTLEKDKIAVESCFPPKCVSRKSVIVVIIGTLLATLIVLVVVYLSTDVFDRQPKIENDDDSNVTLRLISRKEWAGMPPNLNKTRPLDLPLLRVIIIHTVTDPCENMEDCSSRVRSIQNYHMNVRNWGDIGYNFLVGGDGLVFEARGWETEGAHTSSFNKRGVGIAFIGDYSSQLPSKNAIKACKLLLKDGVKKNKLSIDYGLFGQKQFGNRYPDSPGEALYKEIQKWPNWSEKAY